MGHTSGESPNHHVARAGDRNRFYLIDPFGTYFEFVGMK
jgi:hypothetical protein